MQRESAENLSYWVFQEVSRFAYDQSNNRSLFTHLEVMILNPEMFILSRVDDRPLKIEKSIQIVKQGGHPKTRSTWEIVPVPSYVAVDELQKIVFRFPKGYFYPKTAGPKLHQALQKSWDYLFPE